MCGEARGSRFLERREAPPKLLSKSDLVATYDTAHHTVARRSRMEFLAKLTQSPFRSDFRDSRATERETHTERDLLASRRWRCGKSGDDTAKVTSEHDAIREDAWSKSVIGGEAEAYLARHLDGDVVLRQRRQRELVAFRLVRDDLLLARFRALHDAKQAVGALKDVRRESSVVCRFVARRTETLGAALPSSWNWNLRLGPTSVKRRQTFSKHPAV